MEPLARTKAERFPARADELFGIAEVMRTGKCEHLETVPPALLPRLLPEPEALSLVQSLGFHSSLILPLEAGGLRGAAQLVRDADAGAFTADEVATLQRLSGQAATVLKRFREHEKISAALLSERRVRVKPMLRRIGIGSASSTIP